MKNDELLEQHILCLKQLQLSKRQLVWNREHDLHMLTVERAEVKRMELAGKGTPESLAAVYKGLDVRKDSAETDIGYARMEITELDKEIGDLSVHGGGGGAGDSKAANQMP